MRLYLVCGLPGAGKTTRARQLVEAASAVYLNADDWVVALGKSLVDYEFRIRLQHQLLEHGATLLRAGLSVVIEFGSWSRQERDGIRQAGVQAGASTELHFLNAPLDELVRRVRARGGAEAEALASNVLLPSSDRFEQPTADETARYDRYVGPDDAWTP